VKRSSWASFVLAAAVLAPACSSSRTSASPSASSAPAPAPTPTPGILTRIDPNVVEETETYVIHRLPKKDYVRVDERRIRHPNIQGSIEFFKEDDEYYYIQTQKRIPEEEALKQRAEEEKQTTAPQPTAAYEGPPLSDFEDLAPPRVEGRLKLRKVASPGLPDGGMWRASFVVADMNRDQIPDVISPPPRVGDGTLHIWLGDGKGSFAEWPLTFTQGGEQKPFSIDFGGVDIGDIDGDGNLDVVTASHGFGLVSLFGDGKGSFRIVREGLPRRDFSSQTIALLDADGDGKLDIVASRDIQVQDAAEVDRKQVRVYINRGSKGWQFKEDGLVGAFYSNTLHAWDYDGDKKKDVLTGSHQIGALTLLWKNRGDGSFEGVRFPEIESYAYHFATAPGTFGSRRVPAFADAFYMFTNEPKIVRALGITVYSFQDGTWRRHRVWRKKEGRSTQFALAMGDLDRDGLDDVVFADSQVRRLRVFFQRSDGSFVEMAEKDEPAIDSPGQCIRLADLDGDGRLDILLTKTISSMSPGDPGGWSVFLNSS
jgi:hypothetical protein